MSFNVPEFDRTVKAFYEGNHAEMKTAQKTLTDFQNDLNSWHVVDQILEQSSYLQTKFIALNILEDFVKVRWNTLPDEQRFSLRNYVANSVICISSDENTDVSQGLLLGKLNILLVQIVKKEWPKRWPTFIEEIVNSSFTNVNLCKNNLRIIKLLSEEVFDYSSDSLTQVKTRKLKEQLMSEFGSIFELCKKVLSTTTDEVLLTTAMQTLKSMTYWMPSEYATQNDFLDLLHIKLHEQKYQLLALQCFNGIMELDSELPYGTIAVIYNLVFLEINKVLASFSSHSNELELVMIKEAATFLINMLSKYKEYISDPDQALFSLLAISRIPENELFKLCIEYWETFIKKGESCGEIQKQLAILMIENMVMPNDILLVENDEGEITREFVKQSDTAALHDTMQYILRVIAKREPYLIQSTIHEKLSQICTSLYNTAFHEALFKISWAIGALSDTLETEQENAFMETIVQSYIQLSQYSNYQDWVTISCIFYVSGHYTRLLLFREDFMNFVLQKVLSFMHNANEDIKDVACHTLLKISEGFRKQLVENNTLSTALLEDIETVIKNLNQHQICVVYEAAANLIFTSPPNTQQEYLYKLMEKENAKMTTFVMNGDASYMKTVIQYLKVNIAVCKTLGAIYSHQFVKITLFITECYKMASSANRGALSRHIKQLIIELLESLILQNDSEVNMMEIMALLQIVMIDYCQENNEREAKVLSLLTTLLEKTESPVISNIPSILNKAIQIEFIHTLPMIKQNFSDFPEIRKQFYVLLKTIAKKYFQDVFREPELVQYIIDSVLWGTKHVQTEVSYTALKTCLSILEDIVEEEDDVSSPFFETYYVRILTDMLEILVDPDRRNGFEYQSQILARMLMMVQEGEIYTRLFNPEQVSNPLMSNMEFLQQYILDLLTNVFPMLQKSQIEILVMGMFDYSNDLKRFQDDIQDFLVDIRQVDEASVGEQRIIEEREAEIDLLGNL